MRRPSSHSIVLLALVFCLGAYSARSTAEPAERVFAHCWEDAMRLDPQAALQHGERAYLGNFDDSLEDTWRADMLSSLRRCQKRLLAIDDAKSDDDRRSVSMLQRSVDEDIAYYDGSLFELARRLPINQFQSPHLTFAQDAAGSGAYPYQRVEDYDLALRRADAFARWTDDVIGRLREGVDTGVVLPRLIAERILPQLQVHLAGPPEKTEFWHPILAMPATFQKSDRDRLRQAYRIKIRRVIQPAYRRLADYLASEYLPHTRQTVGLGAVPHGHDLYQHWISVHTTTQMRPQDIHAIGKAEVERLLGEIDHVQAMVGFHGTRAEFFDYARKTPALHFQSPLEVVPAYRQATDRIVGHLPQLFGKIPTIPYEIRPLPPESSKTFQGNGDYAAPSADGRRPGILWMNIYAPGVQDRFTVTTIALHEGLPGHHFQAAIALEAPLLPNFRRFGNYTAFVEGWGLYAESLGNEMGLFDDPWQYFGHLNYAILRANRLVIDTGLHALGWTVDDGVRWMTEHSSMTEVQARDEVERYVAYPGQALAYKVGELKIRQLRQVTEESLGARFDVRAFHDRVLRGGPVPLTDLEADIHDFIEGR